MMRLAGVWAMTGVLALVAQQDAARAQNQLSEQAVRTYMDYAWSITPDRFTTPDGKTIMIDRKKRDGVEVPIDVAREVIMAARLTAHAQTCELADEQVANFASLMTRERNKKKWSDQQIVYINQLHLMTVMLLLGQVKVKGADEAKGDTVVLEEKQPKARKLSEAECKSVQEAIVAYVKSGPPLGGGDAPAAAAAAAAPAPAKK